MTSIALFGAGGKMGARLSKNLVGSRYQVRHVEVGEVGRKRMDEFRATVREHEQRIGAGLSAAERATLLDLLRRLRKAAETA